MSELPGLAWSFGLRHSDVMAMSWADLWPYRAALPKMPPPGCVHVIAAPDPRPRP